MPSFAHQYAETNPLSKDNLKHSSVRSEYIDFLEVPDSLAFTTVGTLSEVMSNFSEKLSYSTDAAGKQLKWNLELMLKEKGYSAEQIEDVMSSIESKVDRLGLIAEETPDKLNSAMQSFSRDMQYLYFSLNDQIEAVRERLSAERKAIDTIVMREREAIASEASEVSVKVVDSAMAHLKGLTGTILFYVVLLFAVLLFVPFAMGYFTGKIRQKMREKKQDKSA